MKNEHAKYGTEIWYNHKMEKNKEKCKTKYPVMLVHGIGYNDRNNPYWGDIPGILKKNGTEIFFSSQSGAGTIEENARQVRDSILVALSEAEAEKINLIAHSKGGLESRYLISRLGMEEKVASLTTLATPHRGIKAIDSLNEKSELILRSLIGVFELMIAADGGELIGDKKVFEQFSGEYMDIFNEMVPDAEKVYYQSWAFDMKKPETDPAMKLFYNISLEEEGPNDGLVSVASAMWGNFRGVYEGLGGKGISHSAAVGKRPKLLSEEESKALEDFYIRMICELKESGY
ncbi:MAG: hypothetical protein GX578_04010 [Clostridiales bacterium]|nr:hypothetical protein [Clostridiales bacterium]